MNNIFHIVNGDSTAYILGKSPLEGNVIVWREMLCEGIIHNNVGSDEFWLGRYQYFEDELDFTRLEYFDKTIKEIQKIDEIPPHSEIVCWFEFDLFCQVNLMALCSYLLNSYRKDIKYSLVCVGKEPKKDFLHSLSDYAPQDFQNLYLNRMNISRNNMLFALECWGIYVENDRQSLVDFDFNKSSKFQYFSMAIDQHLKRFPDENGLNQIDEKILTMLGTGKFKKKEIVKKLLIWQKKETVYGFGDMQYLLALEKMKEYYTVEQELYILNDLGKAAVL